MAHSVMGKRLASAPRERSAKEKVVISLALLAAFLSISYLFFLFQNSFGTGSSSDTSIIVSLIAGSFAAYTILVATGLVREFSVKGGGLEFTSILAEKIDDVQADVADSKREVGEKFSVLNNDLQSINNRIDNVMTNINFSSISASQRTNVSQSLTNDLPGLFHLLLGAIKEARSEGYANHGISTKLNPAKKLELSDNTRAIFDKSFELQNVLEFVGKPTVEGMVKRPTTVEITREIQDANYMFYTGRYQKASDIYDDVLKWDPNNLDALVNKGIVLYRLGRHGKAMPYFNKALDIDGGHADALIYKFFALRILGRKGEADLYNEKISKIQINESNIDALANKGLALEKVDKSAEAQYYYNKAADIKVDENNIDALVNKGFALDRIGVYEKKPDKHSEAQKYFDTALKIDSNNTWALYLKACNCSLQQNYEEALGYLQKVIGLSPGYKDEARDDSDFQNLKDDERFKRLVH
jgi:tetratricopeptide (TPR) repeat protein